LHDAAFLIHPTDVVCFKRKEYHQFLHIHLASLRPDFPCFVESAAGPSIVALTMPGHWVIGSLFSNVWSFAGSGDADIDFFTWQYFINYNMDDGWYLTSAPIITANWKASSGSKWTVPFGAGVGKIFRVGKQPVNASAQYYNNVKKPDFGPDWQLRLIFLRYFQQTMNQDPQRARSRSVRKIPQQRLHSKSCRTRQRRHCTKQQ